MNNNTNNNLNNNVIQNNIEQVTPSVPVDQTRPMRFDPMSGQPIVPSEQVAPVVPVEPVVPTTPINEQVTDESTEDVNTEIPVLDTNVPNNINEAIRIQNELQNIPTVGQEKEEFINNVQSNNQEKKEEKKEGVNFVFIIILLVVILGSILFLFPFLLDHI